MAVHARMGSLDAAAGSPNPVDSLEIFDADQDSGLISIRKNWGVWLGVLLLAILLHGLLIYFRPLWSTFPHSPPRVEVQQIDPRKLDQVRKQWKDQAKQLLLNKDKSIPKAEEAPPDSRYMSDRNIRVEKEQRARQTNVVPKPNVPAQTHEKSQTEKPKKSLPKLGSLGVPMNFGASQPKSAANRTQAQTLPQEGGDQSIQDRNLPEGSENILNAQESVYYSFYARIYETIGPLWQSLVRGVPQRRRIQPGDYSTVVDVVCDSSGNLVGVNRIRSSGISEFDEAVDAAWKKIGQFPNPPHGLLDQMGQVHMGWTFTVNVDQAMGLDYAPPERNY